jgi:ATP-dependent DNA helicase RecQ
MLVNLLKQRTGPAIVYVTLQHQATGVAKDLCEVGIPADAYHAGLANETRVRSLQSASWATMTARL